MPRAYDPRRYGPTVRTTDARAASLSVCAATPREVSVRAQEQEHLLLARTLRRYSDDGGSRHSKLLEQQRRAGLGSTQTPSARTVVSRRPPSSVHDEAPPDDCSFHKPGRPRTASTARSDVIPLATTMFAPPQAAPRQLHHQQYPRRASSSKGNRTHDSDNDDDGNTLVMTPTTCLGSSASSVNVFVGHGGDGGATEGAGPEPRGRTRRRSQSWHCRRKAAPRRRSPASSYSSCFARSSDARSAYSSRLASSSSSGSSSICSRRQRTSRSSRTRRNSARNRRKSSSMTPPQHRPCSLESAGHCAGSTRGGEVAVAEEEGAGRECRGRGRWGRIVGKAGVRQGESIDAEELFRRKNKMATYNVTYRRWAESYDRSTAMRVAHERRERLKAEREVDMRRQRAEQEFQKWARSHAPRSASAAAAPTLAVSASSAGGCGDDGLGPRSSYRERASSASPLLQTWAGKRKDWWKADGCSNDEVFSSGLAGGGSRLEQGGAKEEGAMKAAERGGEEEEERKKAREVDRAFRAWLDRKKKQAHDEREAQRAREEELARLRHEAGGLTPVEEALRRLRVHVWRQGWRAGVEGRREKESETRERGARGSRGVENRKTGRRSNSGSSSGGKSGGSVWEVMRQRTTTETKSDKRGVGIRGNWSSFLWPRTAR